MGRVVKRVACDFDWPLHEVWTGYVNPHYEDNLVQCESCNGSGYSEYASYLHDLWYGKVPFKPESRGSKPYLPSDPVIRDLAVRNVKAAPGYYGTGPWAEDQEALRLSQLFNARWYCHLNQEEVDVLTDTRRLMDFTHTWSKETGWVEKSPPYRPTAEEVNRWSLSGMGHDSINCGAVVRARCEKEGHPVLCDACKGEGSNWVSPEAQQRAEAWVPEEPPVGEGYQIWETVSEGSPISPVFGTPEDLAEWMAKNGSGLDKDVTKEQWLAFIKGPGWAPSMVGTSEGLKSGVVAVTSAE